jgi:hypothetical protein
MELERVAVFTTTKLIHLRTVEGRRIDVCITKPSDSVSGWRIDFNRFYSDAEYISVIKKDEFEQVMDIVYDVFVSDEYSVIGYYGKEEE